MTSIWKKLLMMWAILTGDSVMYRVLVVGRNMVIIVDKACENTIISPVGQEETE